MHFLFTQIPLKIQQPSVLDLQHFSLYFSSPGNLTQKQLPSWSSFYACNRVLYLLQYTSSALLK